MSSPYRGRPFSSRTARRSSAFASGAISAKCDCNSFFRLATPISRNPGRPVVDARNTVIPSASAVLYSAAGTGSSRNTSRAVASGPSSAISHVVAVASSSVTSSAMI